MFLVSACGQISPDGVDGSVVDVFSGDTLSVPLEGAPLTIVNLWATWCRPCEDEMPSLRRLSEALPDSVVALVAVNVDHLSRFAVAEWLSTRGFAGFPAAQPLKGLTVRANALPTTLVVSQGGEVIRRIVGSLEWDHPRMLNVLKRVSDSLRVGQ